MIKSYVGIATRRGLQTLVPEQPAAVRRLLQRAYSGRRLPALCFWAVLPDTCASEVRSQMCSGDLAAALATLDRHAQHIGPILPTRGTDPQHGDR